MSKDQRRKSPNVPNSSEDLTEDELLAIEELYKSLDHKGIQRAYDEGLVANVPASLVLRLAELNWIGLALYRRSGEPIGAHLMSSIQELASEISLAVARNDHTLFEQLATILRARSNGVPLRSLTAKELGVQRAPGRKTKAYDLSTVFLLAAIKVITPRCHHMVASAQEFLEASLSLARNPQEEERVRKHAPVITFNPRRISRTELRETIQQLREEAGMIDPQPVTNEELTRWISKTGLRPFMEKAKKANP